MQIIVLYGTIFGHTANYAHPNGRSARYRMSKYRLAQLLPGADYGFTDPFSAFQPEFQLHTNGYR